MRRLARRSALALVLALVATALPASAAVPDVWTRWNIADHWVRSLDYVTPGQLVAGSEDDGVFTASNAVGPWSDISGNLSAAAKHVHQAVGESGQIYLATSAGLFRGSGGSSWSQLGVADSTPPDKRLDQGGVQSVVFPTGSPTSIVVGVAGAGRDGVFYSSDSGKTWTRATGLTSAAFYLTSSPGVMYAAASTGFYGSTDKGHSWTLLADGIPPAETPKRIAVSPHDPSQLIAATVGGVHRSDNAGATWYDASGSGDGALLASEVRAFQLVPSQYWGDGRPRMVAGTSNGVWATLDGGLTWARMSGLKSVSDGVSMTNESVYSLNIGFGAPGSLVAGTQGHGVFALPLSAVEAPGSVPAPTGIATQNSVLSAVDGSWGGTGPFAFRYQWKRCTQSSGADSAGNSCSNVSGETGRTYQPSVGDIGKYLRVGVRASNLVSAAYSAEKLSGSVGPIAAPPGPVPTPPSNWPKLLNATSAPWGQTLQIEASDPTSPASGRWKANGVYAATSYLYRWYRCDGGACVLLDSTGTTYTTTVADVDHAIEATVIGRIGTTSSDERLAGFSGSVYERTPAPVSLPRVVGPAYIGTVLQSTAGAWTGNNPTFTRRWLRCNAAGVQCQPLSPSVTSRTYRVKAADQGYRFRLEVTAKVVDSFQARLGTAQSATSAVVRKAPLSAAACQSLKAKIVKGKKRVTAAKKALRKAQDSGKPARIRKARKALRLAKASLARVEKTYNAGGCKPVVKRSVG